MLSKNTVGARLVSLTPLLQPSNDVSIETHGNSFLDRAIKATPHCIFPSAEWKFRDVGSVNLVIREACQSCQVSSLLRSKRSA